MNIPRKKTLPAVALISVLAVTGCGGSKSDSTSSTSSTASAGASESASPQVVALIKQGISQAQAGNLDAAVTTFNNVLTVDPGNKYAYYNLGLVAQSRKDTKGAIAFYDKALGTDANYTPAMYNKAIALEATDTAGAIALYEKIVQLNPKASTAYYRLSLCYAKQGDTAKAADARKKAVAIDPSLASASPAPVASASPAATPSR